MNKIIEGAEPDTIDSIKDLVAWVEEHGAYAANMATAIKANTTAIANEVTRAKDAEQKLQTQIYENRTSVDINLVGSTQPYFFGTTIPSDANIRVEWLTPKEGITAYVYIRDTANATNINICTLKSSANVKDVKLTVDTDRIWVWYNGINSDTKNSLRVSFLDTAVFTEILDISRAIEEEVERAEKAENMLLNRDLRYGYIKNGLPNLVKNTNLTIPKSSTILGGNKFINLSKDLVVNKTDDISGEFGSHYIVLDLSKDTPTSRLIRSNKNITFENDNEVIVALVDWSNGFIWVNSKTYSVNNVTYNKEIDTQLIKEIQDNISELAYESKKIELETKGFDATVFAAYTYFPPIYKGDKVSVSLLTDIGTAKLAVYLSDKQYPESGYAVNVGYLNNGETKVFDVPEKFDNVCYVKLWAAGMDNTAKDILIKSYNRTMTCPVVVSKMLNVLFDIKKPNLKILDIGNSYTENPTTYIYKLLANAGITEKNANHSHYIAVRGGASFKSWYDCYNDKDNTKRYYIAHKTGKPLNSEPSFTEVTTVKDNGYIDGEAFRNLLQNTDWDLILIHQASAYSADYDKWESHESAGYLKEFVQLIKRTNPQAAIGTYLIHSYNTNNEDYAKYGTSRDRWNEYATAVKNFISNYGIDFVIPYGTAVQNLRESSLQDNYQFSHDGTHLGKGLGCYVAGCCYFQALFAPRYNVNVLGNTYNNIVVENAQPGEIDVNPENALVAQKAAMLAVCDMFNISNPEEYGGSIFKNVVNEEWLNEEYKITALEKRIQQLEGKLQ